VIEGGRKNLLGVSISAVDYESAIAKIMRNAHAGTRCATTALAVHGVITGVLSREHRHRLNSFDLVTPDGQPVRWGLNLLHKAGLKDRVYGPKLTFLVCQEAARQGLPIYFYGSSTEVLSHLKTRMQKLCPGLIIAGAEPSRFRRLTDKEQREAADRIRESGAKILFVGLGCPRQEVFVYEMSKILQMPMLAVGAAFDYYAGLLQEPPEILQRYGLQWLYRLIQEPGRLWKRYLFTNSRYVAMLMAQAAGFWRPRLEDNDVPLSSERYG
jgi:N-acetylglucosaminyldiphosphoundecaprenol N-acetyl-beta-D-mannosaminyltransferase